MFKHYYLDSIRFPNISLRKNIFLVCLFVCFPFCLRVFYSYQISLCSLSLFSLVKLYSCQDPRENSFLSVAFPSPPQPATWTHGSRINCSPGCSSTALYKHHCYNGCHFWLSVFICVTLLLDSQLHADKDQFYC